MRQIPTIIAAISVVLGPAAWLATLVATTAMPDQVPWIIAGAGVVYALAFVLATGALFTIPWVGTRGVLPLGLIGGALNGFLAFCAIAAFGLFTWTWG